MTHIPVPPLPNPHGPGLLGYPWNSSPPWWSQQQPPPPSDIQPFLDALRQFGIDQPNPIQQPPPTYSMEAMLRQSREINDLIDNAMETVKTLPRPSLAAAPRAPRIRAFLRLCRRFGRWVERMDW